jgi:ankyrin repeat protein
VGCAEALLHAGAPPSAPNSLGWTPLHYAAHKGHLECAAALLAHGADADAKITKARRRGAVLRVCVTCARARAAASAS